MQLSLDCLFCFPLFKLGCLDFLLLSALDLEFTCLLRVLKRGVLEILGCLDQLHGEHQVAVLTIVDLHVAGALGVVHEGALHEWDLDRRRLHVVLTELGEVKTVRVLLLLRFHEAAAVSHGQGARAAPGVLDLALGQRVVGALLANEIVCHFCLL